MDILLVTILVVIALVILVSSSVTITIVSIRHKVNKIISNHNDIVHTLEEENRFLQNQLLSIPKELLISVEKMINENPDSVARTIRYFIQTNDAGWTSNMFDAMVKERQKDMKCDL